MRCATRSAEAPETTWSTSERNTIAGAVTAGSICTVRCMSTLSCATAASGVRSYAASRTDSLRMSLPIPA